MALQQKKAKLSDTDVDLQNASSSSAEQADPATATVTKITDLNEHCLEKIFDHLDVDSLFSVANANKWLEHSAASVYGRRFSKNPVNLCSIRTCKQSVYMFSEYICVDSLQFSLAFLRCFGSKIPEIVLFCRRAFSRADDQFLNRYMNQYCADTLQRIHVTESSTFSRESFTRPFTEMVTVDFFGINFSLAFRNLIDWFPVLQNLRISACSMDYNLAIDERLPHLQHLSIPVTNAGWDRVVSLLRLNGQLNSLEMDLTADVNKSANDLLDMIDGNPAITKLTVKASGDTYVTVNSDEIERFANEHSAMVELILPKYLFGTEDVITLIGRLNSLKKFQFRVNERTDYNALVSQLGDEWEHRIGYVINLTTKKQHYSVDLNRKN